MEDETNKKIAELAFEAAMRKRFIYPPKDTLLVTGGKRKINFTLPPEELEKIEKEDEQHQESFLRILLKSPFEEYAKDIYQALSQIRYANVEFLNESRRKEVLAHLQKELEIATALLVCKTDTNGIIISSAKKRCKLPTFLKQKIEMALESEYKDADLDSSPMTYDEAREILECDLSEDVHDFIDNYWREYAIEAGLSAEEIAGGYSYDDIDDDMIEYYRSGSYLKREITIEQIQETINELKDRIKAKQRKGAPRTNERQYSALLVFIKYGCKKKHEHLGYAYECLDHWGFIEDEIKNGWNKTNKYANIQYMKRLFDECTNYKLVIKSDTNYQMSN